MDEVVRHRYASHPDQLFSNRGLKSIMRRESSKIHSEEAKALSDKNTKRKLKTPSQIEALERFYNEHKYPQESMKIEFAEKVGLTEKQVSGWFCHRRLKDKKVMRDEACENGRLDRSSGVIQDHGSGLGQDSCGSTKPGDYRHIDPREADGRRSHFTGNPSDMDDTSSDNSSALQDIYISQGVIPSDIESARYLTQNRTILPIHENGGLSRVSTRPSGYLKLKGNREHAAITAVKRQLGRQYLQDGPPLGIEFEPLPPDAFETPIRDRNIEPYNVNDPVMPHPPDLSGLRKQHVAGTTYDVHNSDIVSQDSFAGHGNIRPLQRPNSLDNYSHHRSKNTASIPNHYTNPLSARSSYLNTSEGSAANTDFYNSNRNLAMSSKHGGDPMRMPSVSKTQIPLYDEKITNEKADPYFHKYDDFKPKTVKRREFFRPGPSNISMWNNKSFDMTGEEPSRRVINDENPYGGKSGSPDYHMPSRVKTNPANDMMNPPKRVRDEYPQQDYVTKMSFSETQPWRNQIKRPVSEMMPSTFSGDETDETSSSID